MPTMYNSYLYCIRLVAARKLANIDAFFPALLFSRRTMLLLLQDKAIIFSIIRSLFEALMEASFLGRQGMTFATNRGLSREASSSREGICSQDLIVLTGIFSKSRALIALKISSDLAENIDWNAILLHTLEKNLTLVLIVRTGQMLRRT